jgi:hypothetical protein
LKAVFLLLVNCGPGAADTSFHLGKTGIGLSYHFLDHQDPALLQPNHSQPMGMALSQEFYSGLGTGQQRNG